jgi:hypothetical protein
MVFSDSIQIGEIIRNAIIFDVKNWTGAPMNADALIRAIPNFFALLEQRRVDYVLVGGIALLHYVRGRNTQDLDLIMALSSLKKLPEIKVASQDANFVRASYQELQVDILLTANPLFKKVQEQYATVERLLDRRIPIATVDGLLLLKLYALPSLYRQGDFARVSIYENDIATLLYYYQPNVDGLMDELSRYVSDSDLAEIRAIVAEAQARVSRFKNKSR